MRPNDMPRPFAPDHSEEAAMGDLIERLQLASTRLGALFGHMLDILGRDGVREIGLDPDSDSDVFKEAADELARLRAEVEQARRTAEHIAGNAVIDELRRDAERWQCVRSAPVEAPWSHPRLAVPTSRTSGEYVNGEDADAAIDAAMGEREGAK